MARQASCDITASTRYDDAFVMARTQITLQRKVQRRARQRAHDFGLSLTEYVRRLLGAT